MSNMTAIAIVSAVLHARLTALLEANGLGGLTVSTSHPEADPDPGVYFKLYRITPNAAARNLDLPTRRDDGSVALRPRLAIDLHYLFTFVGDASRFEPERLAAIVMTDLHARPTITPAAIADYIASLDDEDPLAATDLAAQLERVRFTPQNLDLEHLARLWSMLNQSYYGLSVAYEASVVLLDAAIRPREALPTLDRRLASIPVRTPRLTAVHADGSTQPMAAIGETLVLEGSSFVGASTWVRLHGTPIEMAPAAVRPTRIELVLTPALGLRAGVIAVSVMHRVDVGDGVTPRLRDADESNPLALAIVPTVAAASPAVVSLGGGRVAVRLAIDPVPSPGQDVSLHLDALVGDAAASSRTWELDGDVTVFDAAAMPAGAVLVRVRVDGAPSRVSRNPAGAIVGPTVTFP
ncbi:MAG TPA: DUF4255 domain-containing protein [Nannocystaceae bacterium]|nr:DUF4255 domain-containing protein [Nannocystaceae bacterium]